MAYVPTNWQDFPNLSTPITATRLNNMETGISNAASPSNLTGYPNDVTKLLRGNGAWASNQLDFVAITSSVTTTATTEGTATALITGNSVTYDGATTVRIEVFTPAPSFTQITYVLYRDSTVLGQIRGIEAAFAVVYDTPSAGAHTYKVGGFVSSGTGTFGAGAGGSGNLPSAFLRVSYA